MAPEIRPDRPHRLLLVDDSEVTLEVTSALLIHEGYRVRMVDSGEEALRVLASPDHGIDLVLLDLVMPGLDGYQTLRALRETQQRGSLPVIVVTSNERQEDVLRAFAEGADDYLVKPLQAGISMSKIAARLSVRQESWLEVYEANAGDVVGRKYRLNRQIGTGGFGTVFHATHLDLDATVAIKLLHNRIFADSTAKARLRTEGRVLARLDHTNTVRVWDFDTSDRVPFLVMEFLEGHNLADEMSRRGSLSIDLALEFATQIAGGLAAAHKLLILHRDIKPHNIFVQTIPQGSRIKLLDFGLAAMAGGTGLERGLTLEGEMIGSPRYVAPERILDQACDDKADIYSLGVVLFEMFTGEFPYAIDSTALGNLIQAHTSGEPRRVCDLRPEVPPAVSELVGYCLERKPGRRPTARQVLRSLTDIRRQRAEDGAVEASPDQADTEPIDLGSLDDIRHPSK